MNIVTLKTLMALSIALMLLVPATQASRTNQAATSITLGQISVRGAKNTSSKPCKQSKRGWLSRFHLTRSYKTRWCAASAMTSAVM